MTKTSVVALPLAPKIAQKDKDGKVVLDKKGEAVLVEPTIAVANGLVEDEFKPYEVRVYKW